MSILFFKQGDLLAICALNIKCLKGKEDLVTQKETQHYLRVGKDNKGFADKVRKLMKELFRLTSTEFYISGGGDGDLHQETAEWNSFDAGYNARVELYTVHDDSTNGYAECVSVICRLPGEQTENMKKLLEFLEQRDFVSKYTSFEKRPMGYKSFASYLKNPYSPTRKASFMTTNGSGD